MNELQFGNYKLEVIGSYSLQSQQNAGDIDIDTFITGRKDIDYVNEELKKIINRIDKSDDIYFVELKIQYKDGQKIKFDPSEIEKIKIPEKNFDKIDYFKIDLIISLNGVFQDMSVNYWFSKQTSDIVKDIKKDIELLRDEGRYYKITKRLFSIAKVIDDKPKALIISKYLNTTIGEEYKLLSNLKAIKELLYHYDDPITRKKARINLINIDIKPNLTVIEPLIKKIQKKVDDDGLKFLKGIE
jgi:hypothetical protein